MPTKRKRIALALPGILQDLVENDMALEDRAAAAVITRIVAQHYRQRAQETRDNLVVLKGSELLTGKQEVSLDFSGGLYSKPAQSVEPSRDATGV